MTTNKWFMVLFNEAAHYDQNISLSFMDIVVSCSAIIYTR